MSGLLLLYLYWFVKIGNYHLYKMTETWRRMLSRPPLSPYIRDGGSGLLSWEGDLRRVVIILRKNFYFL